jgi:hypothetical protein
MRCAHLTVVLAAAALAAAPDQARAQEVQTAPLNSWIIIEGDPDYEADLSCITETASSGLDMNDEAVVRVVQDDCTIRRLETASGARGDDLSPLKFRTDLLPAILAAEAEARRLERMYEARRRAWAARGIRRPILSANGDIPFSYAFEQNVTESRLAYGVEKRETRLAATSSGYRLEGTFSESSRDSMSGGVKKAKLRGEVPLSFGPVRIRAGLDTYSVRDTTAGSTERRIGRGIDLKVNNDLSDDIETEFSTKLEYVKDGSSRVNAVAAGVMHYDFTIGDWLARISPGAELAQTTGGGGDSPVSMAIRVKLALTRGPQRIEFAQRLYRKQIMGDGDAGEENRQTSISYGYSWENASLAVRGTHFSRSLIAGTDDDDWQVGAVWSLKLEALADYLR